MNIDVIYMYSSEDMTQIENKSVSLVVTSPPYNIDIQGQENMTRSIPEM